MRWLITGGAGYIGAHVVAALRTAGTTVVVLDNLSTGRAGRLPAEVPLVVADAGDGPVVVDTLRRYRISGVMHMAGVKSAPESIAAPTRYFHQNVAVLAAVLGAMRYAAVTRIVYSSSAAVYGTPDTPLVAETDPARPINPYGHTKLLAEQLLATAGVSWIALRYFNAVGAAAPHLGDTGRTNLLPLAFDALDRGAPLTVTGTHFPTPDGTGVRDYVHVSDLAQAHRLAAARLAGGPCAAVYNAGAGRGRSVLDVLGAVREVTGCPVPYQTGPARPGDPAEVVAAIDRIRRELSWRPRLDLLDAVDSAWRARCRRGTPNRPFPPGKGSTVAVCAPSSTPNC